MAFSQPEWDTGFWVPGAFKLDHLKPFKPILFTKFSNFSTFILGGQFLLPQRERRAENGKMAFSQPEWDTGFWVPGAFKLNHLKPFKPILFTKFSNFSTLILGANSYYPRERERERERGGLKKGKWHSHNLGETQDYECLGHSNRTICSPLSLFCSLNFQAFQLLY